MQKINGLILHSQQVAVNPAICHSCGACVGACPENCITLVRSSLHIDQQACTGCERCVHACPMHAISLLESSMEIVR